MKEIRATRMLAGIAFLAMLAGFEASPACAQVGPGPVAGPVNVTSGSQTVVGTTTITATGATNGANVTGGTLFLSPTAGPAPGPISVQTLNGNALQATVNGALNVIGPGITLQTQGGHAVLVNGASASATLSGTAITTTGTGSGLAAIAGTINATGVTINNTGISTPTVSAGHGAIAESGGTILLHSGNSIATGAFNAVGLGASGSGSRIVADSPVSVTMNGRGAMGIYLHDSGQVSLLPNSVLQMNGTSSAGVTADNTTVPVGTLGSGLTINLDAAGVPGQAGSSGVVALNGGVVSVQDLHVQGTNAAAGAWAQAGSTVNLLGRSTIDINSAQNPTSYFLTTPFLVTADGPVSSAFGVTSAIPVAGLLAQGAGAFINSSGTTINVTTGNGAAGADAGLNGIVDMTANTIVTTGANSFGLRVDSNGLIIGRDSFVTTSGGGATLFINGGPGVIDLSNTIARATGPNTAGLTSLNVRATDINIVDISGGSLVSEESTAVEAVGPLTLSVSNGAVITGSPFLLAAFDQTVPGGQATAVQFGASTGSVLTGDAFVFPNSTANIDLLTGSTWTGAAFDVTNVTVDPTSTWNVTANSVVTNDVINAGLVQFTPPVGGVFKTLTTTDYIGNNGRLGVNTFLGADGSPSDILIIDSGTATGSTGVIVRNTNGPGALTVADGILVIDTINGATSTPTAFNLIGDYVTPQGRQAVVGGAFAYTLNYGGVGANAADNNWYLRSVLQPTPPGPTPPGPGPTPDPGPPVPLYQPGVPLYEAYPQNLLALSGLPTMQQRVGNRYWQQPAPAEEIFCKDPAQNFKCRVTNEQESYYVGGGRAVIEGNGVWTRIEGAHYRIEPDESTSGTDYDTDLWKLQAGFDGVLHETEDGSRLIGGINLHYGQANSDVSSIYGDGNIDTDGYGLGGTLTWLDQNGFYVDGQASVTWFDSDLHSDTADRSLTDGNDGFGYALSVETGKKVDMSGNWTVTPQAQLVYANVDFDDFSDVFGADISIDGGDSLLGRLGISADRELNWQDEAGKTRRSHIYGMANLYYEFLDGSEVDVSGTKFETRPEKLWGGIGVGGSYNWNDDKYSVYGEVSANTSLASFGDSYSVNGTAGFRVRW